ncbi:chaperone protein EcpD [Pseudomonas simiae]|uniref:fimbrial biogenesis chaperone n=1 Tax=Pseudomonas simiae TaxID=321846 RepID=UPI0008DF1664|nr:fimbria/pilus periplasmic chaperone [Pseudomonas simiae]SFB39477.1 chaperone protein EcpD [Pseudomonas simiae]
MKIFTTCLFWLITLAVQLVGGAHASVVMNGTRVIYPGGEREVSVRLTNNGTLPSLVQSWVDSGDPKGLPENSVAPFFLTPPVTRIEPGEGQTLRLMATPEAGSQKNESVFWLNVLEIPPSPTGEKAVQNTLQMSFRTRVKIFYRPQGLNENDAAQAPTKLLWRVVHLGQSWDLECSNPTSYHVSFGNVELNLDGHSYTNTQGGMVAPGATFRFPMPGLTQEPTKSAIVTFESINDFGTKVSKKTRLEL